MEDNIIVSNKTSDGDVYILKIGDGRRDVQPTSGTLVRKRRTNQTSDVSKSGGKEA